MWPDLVHTMKRQWQRAAMRRGDILIFMAFVTIITITGILWRNPSCDIKQKPYTTVDLDKVAHSWLSPPIKIVPQRKVNDDDTYLLNQHHCKIPLISKSTPAYLHFLGQSDNVFDQCDQALDFARLQDNVLKLTDDSVDAKSCCVREVSRDFVDHKDSFKRTTKCLNFDPETKTLDVSQLEYLEVECEQSRKEKQQKIYSFLANVPLKGTLKRKSEYWKFRQVAGGQRPPNIFVLVIDSTTRPGFYRGLPKTTDFLLTEMGFVDFKGHMPLGEATLVNAVPFLMGLHTNEFWGTYKLHPREYWDSAPFIWKTFDYLNYITGYIEDLAEAGTFNYGGQKGFVHRPTDIYPRPMMLAYDESLKYSNVTRHGRRQRCFGHRGIVEFLMDYQLDILTQFSHVPSFLVSWPCWPQHDFAGSSLNSQDETYLKIFKKVSSHLLENTLFVVTADHSFTHGPYYDQTTEGLLERRSLPLLIRLPDKLRRENGTLLQNLVANSESVTSHFDVYQTLLQVARMVDPSEQVQGMDHNGQSLFQALPNGRTCHDAGIPETMCSCNRSLPPKTFHSNSSIHPSLHLNRTQFGFPYL